MWCINSFFFRYGQELLKLERVTLNRIQKTLTTIAATGGEPFNPQHCVEELLCQVLAILVRFHAKPNFVRQMSVVCLTAHMYVKVFGDKSRRTQKSTVQACQIVCHKSVPMFGACDCPQCPQPKRPQQERLTASLSLSEGGLIQPRPGKFCGIWAHHFPL